MVFSTTERDALYQAVVGGGADPDECDLKQDRTYLHIKHRGGSWLRLSDERNSDSSLFVIDMHIVNGQVGARYFDDRWKDVVYHVTDWARLVREETPDLWEQSALKGQLLGVTNASDVNSPFSESEQAEIASQFGQVKSYLDKLQKLGELTAQAVAQVSAKLDEAEEASKRIGRKDWRYMLLGIGFTLIATDVVTPEVGKHILVTVLQGLLHLFGNLPPMLPS